MEIEEKTDELTQYIVHHDLAFSALNNANLVTLNSMYYYRVVLSKVRLFGGVIGIAMNSEVKAAAARERCGCHLEVESCVLCTFIIRSGPREEVIAKRTPLFSSKNESSSTCHFPITMTWMNDKLY